MDKYDYLGDISENGKPETAWKVCHQMLVDNPNDPRALTAASFIMWRLGALPQSYHFGASAVKISPNEPIAWINYGHAASELWLVKEAEAYYQKALVLSQTQDISLACLLNLGALYIDNGLFDRGEKVTKEILKIDPEHRKALSNLGLCKLARHDWSGWAGYRLLIGSPLRLRVQYKDEPEWDGSPGKNVVVYAEQGLGDEISFASVIPDAAKVCKKLIFDCDGRLEGLFRRSFPQAIVYGTRVKESKWSKADRDIEASLPVGQLGEFFRTTNTSFPGTPYLKACPVRMTQWRSILRRPTVGIAWTGGISRTNARNRRLLLEDMLPILSLDADFVSLQYKDASEDIAEFKRAHPDISLTQYPWATLTHDYDDTAALVAVCDYVCCIQTAVAHTAGALGVPATVLIPKATTWRYGLEGNTIPWYRSLRVIRQTNDHEWTDEINRAAEHIRTYLGRLSQGTRDLTREGQLRDSLDSIRTDGQFDHRADGDHSLAGLRMRVAVQPREAPEGQK